MSNQLQIIRASVVAMQEEWDRGTSTSDTVASRLRTILTAAERLAGENDAMRDWGRHLERRMRLYESHPEVARIRAEHGITAAMMGEQE